MNDGRNLMDTEAAAAYLGLQPSTLEQWRWKGRGPEFIRLSRRAVRYERAALDLYKKRNTVRSTSDGAQGGDDARRAG